MAGQIEAMVWEVLGSSDYRERVADGWCDTGHHREWCGGEYKTALMVKDVGAEIEGGDAFDYMKTQAPKSSIANAGGAADNGVGRFGTGPPQ